MFNIIGQQVLHNSFDSNGTKTFSLQNLETGIYVVEVNTKSGKVNKKIIVE